MLLIMDVFSKRETKDLLNVLKENNILMVNQCKINFVNGTVNWFCIVRKWIWIGDFKADVRLTFIKPLQIEWLSEFYNYIKSSDSQEIWNLKWLFTFRYSRCYQNRKHTFALSWQFSRYKLLCADQEVSVISFFV